MMMTLNAKCVIATKEPLPMVETLQIKTNYPLTMVETLHATSLQGYHRNADHWVRSSAHINPPFQIGAMQMTIPNSPGNPVSTITSSVTKKG
jgi:hypothetical protein